MKTVGIVIDNYKLEKFKTSLDKGGYTYNVVPFKKGLTLIRVVVLIRQVPELAKLCQLNEIEIKRSN